MAKQTFAERHDSYTIRSKSMRLLMASPEAALKRRASVRAAQLKNHAIRLAEAAKLAE